MNSLQYLGGLIVLLIPTYLIRFTVFGIPTTFFEVIVWLSLIVVAVDNVINKRKLPKVDPLVRWGTLLVVTGALIGALVSPDRVASLGLVKGFILTPIVAGIVVLFSTRNTEFRLLYSGFLLSGAVIGAHAFYQYLAGKVGVDGRVIGIYGFDDGASPNYLALYLTPIVVLGILNSVLSIRNKNIPDSCFWRRPEGWALPGGILASAMSIAGILVSQSRVGIALIFAFGLVIISQNVKSSFTKKFIPGIVGLALILGFIIYGMPNLSAPEKSGRVSSSNNIRLEIWQVTIKEIVPKHWLTGVGLGNFQTVFADTTNGRVNFNEYITPRALTPHNLLLSSWMDTGIIGLIGLITVILGVFRKLNTKYQIPRLPKPGTGGQANTKITNSGFPPGRAQPSGRRQILDSSKIVLLTILLMGILDTPIFKNDLGAMFWIIIAMVAKTSRNDLAKPHEIEH